MSEIRLITKNLENISNSPCAEAKQIDLLLQDLDGSGDRQPLPDLRQQGELTGLSSSLKLSYEQRVGRHLVAKEDIKVGDIIGKLIHGINYDII